MKKAALGGGRGVQRRVLEGVAGMCELLMTVLEKSWRYIGEGVQELEHNPCLGIN